MRRSNSGQCFVAMATIVVGAIRLVHRVSYTDGMQPSVGDGKAAWRAWAQTLPGVVDSSAVVDALRAFLTGQSVTAYVLTFRPMVGEVDLEPLLHEYRCAVTRTWPHGRLTVHRADVDMERHRWGYLQPIADAPELPLDEIGVVLVPGVLFDRRGGRLGHGAGYYDRLLPRLRADAVRIGVTTEDRVVDELPTDANDVRMTHLATGRGLRPVGT
jgi:5-formyltetrahydrofolate cyclo-ligase